MPFDNIAKKHFTDAEKLQLNEAINTITAIITANSYNLNAKERSQYGKIGDQKRLLINKVRDIKNSTPDICSPDVDWAEFEADYQTRAYAGNKISELKSVLEMLTSIRILHDHDNFNAALQDYQYATYKTKFGNQHGYSTKIDSLRVFFPKTGKRKKKEE